jgi:two-component system LytT family response regulator
MTVVRTMIVDDEPFARQRMRRMLVKHPEIEIVCECEDGNAALKAALEYQPELILLDIQMPNMDGFEVADAIGSNRLPLIVFVTSFDEHAIRAFEACALDYLLKPVSAPRLATTIARMHHHLQAIKALALDSEEATDSEPITLQVRAGQRTSFVRSDQIDWIEADGNYAILHVDGRNHFLRATMMALEKNLPVTFLRISRSAIANLKRIKELKTSENSHFAIMNDGSAIPIYISIREVKERLLSV